jgi:hypothetical protein
MSYFKNFPEILYSFSTGYTISAFVMTDILRRVKMDDANITNLLSYDEYDILDGETPEIIADKVYNDPTYHWVILVANEIIDPRYDWPLSTTALNLYIADKYGTSSTSIHHYYNDDGDVVHISYAGIKYSVTNAQYETELNETKRRIRIVKPEFVPRFVENFVGLLNNGE